MDAVILGKQADDGLVIKEIKHGQVRTQTIIDGKAGYTDTRDIKRMGYGSPAELIEYLKANGYTER